MNQDKEAMIVLALGILFCLIIIIISYSTDNSTSQIVDKWNGERASNQYGLFLIDLKAENKDN
jgi:preprotein translocase subunit SecG